MKSYPRRWAALGGAAVGVALSVPMVGSAMVTSPVPTLVVVATFIAGFALVGLALSAADPLTRAVRRSAA